MGVERLASRLRKAFMAAGGAFLILLVLLATGNVFLRVAGVPRSGAYELVSYLGALVIAAALGHTQKEKDHIVVEILSAKFPERVKRILDAASAAVCAALFGVVTWRTVVLGLTIRRSGEVSETLKIPYHPFVYAVACGFGLLALTLVLDFFEAIGRGKK